MGRWLVHGGRAIKSVVLVISAAGHKKPSKSTHRFPGRTKYLGRSVKAAQASMAASMLEPTSQSDEEIAALMFIGDEMEARPLNTPKHSALNIPLALVPMLTITDIPDCHGGTSQFAQDSKLCRACHLLDKCSDESQKDLATIAGANVIPDLLKRHDVARKKALEILKEKDCLADLEYDIELAKLDEFYPKNSTDFDNIVPKCEPEVVISKVIDTSGSNSMDTNKDMDEQIQAVEPIENADSSVYIVPPVLDLLSQIKGLLATLKVHKNYALVRNEFVRLSCLLNSERLLAPAFRPQPEVGKVRGSAVYMDIHRDQIRIDCHWLHCKREVVVTRDAELQPLFDLETAFPFDLAKKFVEQKWTRGHRIRQLLVLTPRQQCQLATLRGDDVDGRFKAALRGLGKGPSRVPPKITAVRLKLYEWAERNNGVRKLLNDYENLWLARELLGNAAPIQQVGELFSLISGKPPLDYKTVKGKLETLGKHVGGAI